MLTKEGIAIIDKEGRGVPPNKADIISEQFLIGLGFYNNTAILKCNLSKGVNRLNVKDKTTIFQAINDVDWRELYFKITLLQVTHNT